MNKQEQLLQHIHHRKRAGNGALAIGLTLFVLTLAMAVSLVVLQLIFR